MRTLASWGVIVAIAVAAIAAGIVAGQAPASPRPSDQTVAVDDAWYAKLPMDPSLATEAYLARIPAAMRARGEVSSDAHLLVVGLRLLTLLVATFAIYASGFAVAMRDTARRISARPIVVDALVALQYFIALYALDLPVNVFGGFVLSRRFGFSDESFSAWLADDFVNWAVFTCFYVVGMLLIFRVIRRRPQAWVLWAVGIYVVLRGLFAFVDPTVIEPLTNTFKPLPEGTQKQAILALAHANGMTDATVVTSDASRQTRLLNAHVSGFGKSARITVDDNTLEKTSEPMLRMVVAHEIGHFVLDHELASVITGSIVAGIGFLFVAGGLRVFVPRLSARWSVAGPGDIAALPLFWGLFLLWGFLSLPLDNAISRVYEHQADMYGLNASRAPHGMAEFMIHDADTSRLSPSALEYGLFFSHPSDAERVMTAMKWRAAMQGAPP